MGISLARAFPNLSVIVQDNNTAMLQQAKETQDLSDLKHRIKFAKYDFFTPQPIKDAGAYLMCQIIHN